MHQAKWEACKKMFAMVFSEKIAMMCWFLFFFCFFDYFYFFYKLIFFGFVWFGRAAQALVLLLPYRRHVTLNFMWYIFSMDADVPRGPLYFSSPRTTKPERMDTRVPRSLARARPSTNKYYTKETDRELSSAAIDLLVFFFTLFFLLSTRVKIHKFTFKRQSATGHGISRGEGEKISY